MPWFKGNLHTHTNKSDGDSSPERVINWYKKNKYNFLVLSDHNQITILKNNTSKLLLIPGEEVTVNIPYPIHLNAIGIKNVIKPTIRTSKVATLQANINNIISAGGLAQINHPNFRWALTGDDLVGIEGGHFIEIYNGNFDSHNNGGGGKKSVEEMWDQMLTNNIKIWGVAVDDSHHFKEEFRPTRMNPRRGWVEVFAKDLSEVNILKSLISGDFYFSTGIKFKNISYKNNKIKIKIFGDIYHEGTLKKIFINDSKYTTQLISNNGKIIDEAHGKNVVFNLKEINKNLTYLRTKTISTTGCLGWTQPYFI